MSERMISLKTFNIQNIIGEVVILVDDKIQF